MGIFDKAKSLAGKAKEAAADNADKIDDGIDKAAEFVDGKTKGKYADKVDKAQGAAHKAVDKLAEGRGDEGRGNEGPSAPDDRP